MQVAGLLNGFKRFLSKFNASDLLFLLADSEFVREDIIFGKGGSFYVQMNHRFNGACCLLLALYVLFIAKNLPY